jgi:hypothetical protein
MEISTVEAVLQDVQRAAERCSEINGYCSGPAEIRELDHAERLRTRLTQAQGLAITLEVADEAFASLHPTHRQGVLSLLRDLLCGIEIDTELALEASHV